MRSYWIRVVQVLWELPCKRQKGTHRHGDRGDAPQSRGHKRSLRDAWTGLPSEPPVAPAFGASHFLDCGEDSSTILSLRFMGICFCGPGKLSRRSRAPNLDLELGWEVSLGTVSGALVSLGCKGC